MFIILRLCRQGLRELRVNICSQVMTLVAVTLIVFLGAMFILLMHNIKIQLYEDQGDISFELYWDKTLKESEIKRQWQMIKQFPSVSSITTYTPNKALKALSKTLHESVSLDWLKSSNPLPPTAVVTVKLTPHAAKKMVQEYKSRFEGMKGVKKVHFNPLHAQSTSSWISILHRLVWPFTVVLAFIIGLVIGNTFKLSHLSKREELEVLKLVGASRWYIQFPVLFGAGIQAILSTFFALLLLKLTQIIFLDLLNVPPIWIEIEFLTFEQIAYMVGLLTFVSIFSSWLAIRNY